MSTSMLTSWVRDWGEKLQHEAAPAGQRPAVGTTGPLHDARRSRIVADLDTEHAVDDMRLQVLEKTVNLLREENDLIRRLLDQMVDRRTLS